MNFLPSPHNVKIHNMILKKWVYLQNDSYLSSNSSKTTDPGTKLKPGQSFFYSMCYYFNFRLHIYEFYLKKLKEKNIEKKGVYLYT